MIHNFCLSIGEKKEGASDIKGEPMEVEESEVKVKDEPTETPAPAPPAPPLADDKELKDEQASPPPGILH